MLLNNSAALFATQIIGRVIRFLYMVVVARLLGPEEVGIFLYGIALYLSALGIAEFGQNVFLSQRLGKATVASIPVLRNSFVLVCISTLVASLGFALLVMLSEPMDTLWIVLSFVGALAARAMVIWVRFAFTALEDPGWIPRFEVTFRSLEVIVGVALLLAGGGLVAICILHCLVWIAEAALALGRVKRRFPGVLRFAGRTRYLRLAATVSAVLLVSATATTLFGQLAVLMLRHIQDDAAFVGQFGITMQFLNSMLILPSTIGAAFLPRLSRAYRKGDGGRDLVIGAKLLGTGAVLISILASAYGPPIITRMLGEAYAPTADGFGILSWVFMPYALALFVGQGLSVIDRRNTAAAVMLLMVVTQGLLLLWLYPTLDKAAIIVSMLAGSLAGMATSLLAVHRQLQLSDATWPLKLLVTTGVAYAVLRAEFLVPWLQPLVAMTVAVALFAALRVLNSDDMFALRRVLRQSLPIATH